MKQAPRSLTALLLLAAGCSRAPLPQRRILYYYDPMHPAYRSDKPGISPDCHMELVAKYADELRDDCAIHLAPNEERAAGIETVIATEQDGLREVRAPGKVWLPESRRYKVSGGADGLVQKVLAETGASVRKGQVLASYISRDVSTPQQGFIYALDAVDRVNKTAGHTQDQLAPAVRQVNLAYETLTQLGMDEAQIAELASTRSEMRAFYLTAPIDGVVTARNASSGTRFSKGDDLFEIASTNSVWIEASVFAADGDALAGIAFANVLTPDGGRIVARRLPAVAQFDADGSRTDSLASLVRLETANPSRRLLPGMYVTVVFEVHTPKGVAVPAESVIDSGSAAHVFVRRSEGGFEVRRVTTGWRTRGLVRIVEGLRAGEAVARSGVFLLDSETQIRAGGVVP
jgi:Cu(I)/Ag(I) efflux system membrane fusion protein